MDARIVRTPTINAVRVERIALSGKFIRPSLLTGYADSSVVTGEARYIQPTGFTITQQFSGRSLPIVLVPSSDTALLPNNLGIPGAEMPSSIDFTFTDSDLDDGKYLVKYHGFNAPVDVSVFSNNNEEVEVGVDISDLNTVRVDLSRLTVEGLWLIKIEK